MRLKTDSFVVETDVYYPTDYNLGWDSARKSIDCAEKLGLPGWRKSTDWRRRLKGLMRAVGKARCGGGWGRAGRIREAAKAYLTKAKALEKKLTPISEVHSGREKEQWDQLSYYYEKMLIKHIDLVKRRLGKGEKIPHKEKVFSIFQPWTELIKNHERRPPVEFGKKLAVTSDQYHLIVD